MGGEGADRDGDSAALAEISAAAGRARRGEVDAALAACAGAALLGARRFAVSRARGDILRLTGNLDAAIDAYIIALHEDCSPMEHWVTQYEIADAYEGLGRRDQALYYFQLLVRADAGHDDVRGNPAARVARLTGLPDEPA